MSGGRGSCRAGSAPGWRCRLGRSLALPSADLGVGYSLLKVCDLRCLASTRWVGGGLRDVERSRVLGARAQRQSTAWSGSARQVSGRPWNEGDFGASAALPGLTAQPVPLPVPLPAFVVVTPKHLAYLRPVLRGPRGHTGSRQERQYRRGDVGGREIDPRLLRGQGRRDECRGGEGDPEGPCVHGFTPDGDGTPTRGRNIARRRAHGNRTFAVLFPPPDPDALVPPPALSPQVVVASDHPFVL
jgi:hypothetical protein